MTVSAVVDRSQIAGGAGGGTPPGWLLAAVSQVKILTKERTVVRFGDVMNYAQLDFVRECERQLATKGQIRICVLKARQIGISTCIEAILFVLAVMCDDMHSLIVSHRKESAQGILDMTKRYWATWPFARFHQEEYNGKNQLSWSDTGSNVEVVTAKNLEAGRSSTIHGLHASEVGFWPDPTTLMRGLNQAIPTFGLTAIFLESTANGIGNYFHKMCMESMKGENEYAFRFYPWHQHPEYTASHIPADMRHQYKILDELDEEERWLVDTFDLPMERLIWRRWAIANKCNGDLDTFHQEYPSTPMEAFVATGRNVFHLPSMLRHYQPRTGTRGILVKRGNRIEFIPSGNGWLTIYQHPSSDRGWGVYLIGGDPTHTLTGDNACMQVLNRRTLEQCAVYRHKIDAVTFGKHMQLVGAYYHQAMLAPEREGPGGATVGCVVADNYPNIYKSQNVAKQPGHIGDMFGWSTNSSTKHVAIQYLIKTFSDPVTAIGGVTHGLIIHDEQTMLELRDYVTSSNGLGYENGNGSEYDDGVMALAIANAVHQIEVPPPPYTPSPVHERPPRHVTAVPSPGPQILAAGAVELPKAGDQRAADDPDTPPPDPPWMAWENTKDH